MMSPPGYAYRYALYLAPPAPWRDVGSRWLGRCADTGRDLPRADGSDHRLHAWTEAPRFYGLHATLKAPLRLASGTSPSSLDQAVRKLALACSPFDVRLERRCLRGFLAWCLAEGEPGNQQMQELSEAAVASLDGYRAPASEAERARRNAHPMAPEEQAMLAKWGYPYAFDTFTFHITLTGKLDAEALAQADRLFAHNAGDDLPEVMPVSSVSLYVQPVEGAAFVAARHYGFDGSIRDAVGAPFLSADSAAS